MVPPRVFASRFNGTDHRAASTNTFTSTQPIKRIVRSQTIYLYGQVMGEVSVSPEALYWSVTDAAQTPAERPEAVVMRRVTIRSANGQAFELKNP